MTDRYKKLNIQKRCAKQVLSNAFEYFPPDFSLVWREIRSNSFGKPYPISNKATNQLFGEKSSINYIVLLFSHFFLLITNERKRSSFHPTAEER